MKEHVLQWYCDIRCCATQYLYHMSRCRRSIIVDVIDFTKNTNDIYYIFHKHFSWTTNMFYRFSIQHSRCTSVCSSPAVLHSQDKVLVPHRVERLRLDLGHLNTPGRKHLLCAQALLQFLFPFSEAELSFLFLFCVTGALTLQNSQHAIGVTIT